MIDIHSHILPGVDDGSRSLEMTKNILAEYVREGIEKVMCTPHQGKALRRPEVLKAAFAKLVDDVKDYPVQLLLGSEIYYYEGMLPDMNSGELLTLNNTKYVLVEFSTRNDVVYIPDAVYDLSVAGYRPIVAHIERYDYLKESAWTEIKDNGALIQVNAASFAKKDYAKTIKRLFKRGVVDFIASDCHSDGRRNVDFTAARAYITKKAPREYYKFFGDNDIFADI